MDFWIFFLHFLSEKGCHEMGPPILPQLPGGGAVALGAGNKRRSFILFLGGQGLYSWGSFGYCVVVLYGHVCFGRANPFFLEMYSVIVCGIIFPTLPSTYYSLFLYLLTPSLTSLLSHFLYP